jgi:hypothetical protein
MNGIFAEEVARELPHDDPETKFTLPHQLGERQGWSQWDFNKFWMYYLSGVNPQAVRQFEAVSIDEVGKTISFDDHTADRTMRALQYKALAVSYKTFLQKSAIPTNTVSRLVMLPEYDRSIGCQHEKFVAEQFQVPVDAVIFDRAHHAFESRITKRAPWVTEDYSREHTGERLAFYQSLVMNNT